MLRAQRRHARAQWTNPHRSSSRGYITSEVDVDKAQQLINGVFIEVVGEKAVRREWKVRFAFPQEIDEMATRAGLQLEQRWETYAKDPFNEHSRRQISVYGKAHTNKS